MGALNILLVDDDQNLATTLSYGIFKAMGKAVSVAVCFNPTEALVKLGHQRYDVVISDFNMPGTSGHDFLKHVQQLYRETILILITAYDAETLAEEMYQHGIGYLTKPFEPTQLINMIHNLLKRKSASMGIQGAATPSSIT